MPINDPNAVREQYATEDRLETRRAVWRGDAEGRHPQDVAAASIAAALSAASIAAVLSAAAQNMGPLKPASRTNSHGGQGWDLRPAAVLEVGCGTGVFAARLKSEHPTATLIATDQSARLVEITRERGVDGRVADLMDLPFDDDSFDVVVAMWMLYHVPDLAGALAEVRRVLRPGGTFVAVTNGDEHMAGLLQDAGGARIITQFSTENGGQALSKYFDHVERTDLATRAVFPDHAGARAYLATFDADLAEALPYFDVEREYAGAATVFIAR